MILLKRDLMFGSFDILGVLANDHHLVGVVVMSLNSAIMRLRGLI